MNKLPYHLAKKLQVIFRNKKFKLNKNNKANHNHNRQRKNKSLMTGRLAFKLKTRTFLTSLTFEWKVQFHVDNIFLIINQLNK
jgi:hypothetical protein